MKKAKPRGPRNGAKGTTRQGSGDTPRPQSEGRRKTDRIGSSSEGRLGTSTVVAPARTRRAAEPPPKYATEWDAERGCVVDTITRQPVTPVEPVRHGLPLGTPTTLVREGLIPVLFTQYVCDVRWREADCPKLGTVEREEVFRGCERDFRFGSQTTPEGVRRCWACPYWKFHPEETPL